MEMIVLYTGSGKRLVNPFVTPCITSLIQYNNCVPGQDICISKKRKKKNLQQKKKNSKNKIYLLLSSKEKPELLNSKKNSTVYVPEK